MTFRQRIETFPEPHRSQMLANTAEHRLDSECKEESESGVVAGVFIWDNAPEGFAYWKALWKETNEKEESKP